MSDLLSPEIRALHVAACRAGEPGYMDPETGLFVQTSDQLALKEGCCGSNCRHCPWPAAEQRRAGRPTIRTDS
jgi:hypothetical protein